MRLLFVLLVLGAEPVFAERAPLKVGVAGAAPFVIDSRPPTGFSVDVFSAVATSAGLEVELGERWDWLAMAHHEDRGGLRAAYHARMGAV